jgi:hypothetical protein
MAKKTLVREYDKFMLRLPPGMRERIKAKSERAGMSMNEAIVWVLEKEFPAKITFDERVEELANLVSMLKDSKNPDEGVENLIAEIQATLDQIYRRKLDMPSGFRGMVAERLLHWQEQELDDWRDKNESPFDDDHFSKIDFDENDPFSFAESKPEKKD